MSRVRDANTSRKVGTVSTSKFPPAEEEKQTFNFTVGSSSSTPSIQAIINSLEPHAGKTTITIPAGTYSENLRLENFTGNKNDLSENSQGITLLGDTRSIVGMSFVDGEINAHWGISNLGTAMETVDLVSTAANSLTVNITSGAGVAPDLEAAGVAVGDHVILTDDSGNMTEHIVVTVTGNTITYDGVAPTMGGPASAITFCPNVVVQNDSESLAGLVVGHSVEVTIQGIRFKVGSNISSLSYNIYNRGSMTIAGCIFDDLSSSTSFISCRGTLECFSGSIDSVSRFDGISIIGHNGCSFTYGTTMTFSNPLFILNSPTNYFFFQGSISQLTHIILSRASLIFQYSKIDIFNYIGIQYTPVSYGINCVATDLVCTRESRIQNNTSWSGVGIGLFANSTFSERGFFNNSAVLGNIGQVLTGNTVGAYLNGGSSYNANYLQGLFTGNGTRSFVTFDPVSKVNLSPSNALAPKNIVKYPSSSILEVAFNTHAITNAGVTLTIDGNDQKYHGKEYTVIDLYGNGGTLTINNAIWLSGVTGSLAAVAGNYARFMLVPDGGNLYVHILSSRGFS